MPSENMDQGHRHLGSSSSFSVDNCFPHRQIGMRRPEHMAEHSDSPGPSMTSWRAGSQYFGPRTDLYVRPPPRIVDMDTVGLNEIHYENSFPSNSVSEAFDKQLKLAPKRFSLGEYVNTVDQNFGKQKCSDSLEECEEHSLACLLPDDDLLTGVFDDQEYVAQPSAGDDINEDIFPYDGEMNFEADDNISSNTTPGSLGGFFPADQQGSLNTLYANGHSYSEHPSRTLLVRNINASVDDVELRTLFEQHGDIRSLYTGCKHRGFVMVSYYDIRAALDAMRALQKKSLSHWKFDIHFSIPEDNSSEKDTNEGTLVIFNLDSSVTRDDIHQIFGVYGGIRQIRETPNRHHHKFIEFYDVRAAEAALQGLNGSMIRGKKIKVQTSHLGGARRCLTQQYELNESNGRPGIPNNSPSGCYGTIPLGALNSVGLDIRAVQGSHSANRAPPSPFMGAAFRGVSSRIQSMPSPIRVASVCSQNDMLGRREPIHSPGQTNFVVQQIPNFPPHTLPGYAVGFPHGLHNSSTMSTMGIMPRPSEGSNTRYINNAGFSSINSNAFEHNEGAFGDSGNEIYPLHVHPCTWNSSSNYYHQPRGPVMWSGGPVYVNTLPSYPLQQVHGLPGVPSPTMKAVRPLQQRRLCSEITENPFFLRLQRAFQDDPTDPPAIHPGSPGSTEPYGNCPIHIQEHVSRINIHAGGDCSDPTHVGSPAHAGSPVHVGSPVPRQRCHFSRRKTPYDMSNEQAEKYELDVERINRGEDSRTTLMIKNIPNKYTSKMLLAVIDELHKGTYDFIYLPIDFKNKCNVGYAFINMMDPKQIVPFYQAFHGKRWDRFNSEKVASLAYARIQGKVALVSHFQNSSLMNEDKRCRPILFHSDGPNAGVQEPFPVGDNIRSRPGRVRTSDYPADYEESPEGSPPTSAHEEGEHIGTSSSASSAGFE